MAVMETYFLYAMLVCAAVIPAAGAVFAPAATAVLLKTSRWSRHAYYTAVTAAGFFLALKKLPPIPALPAAYLAAALVLINILFASSAILNNVYDTYIDRVNSKENSTNSGVIGKKAHLAVFSVLFAMSLLLSAAVSLYTAALAAIIHAAAFVYSCPPARIKRFFPLKRICVPKGTLFLSATYSSERIFSI